MHAQIAVREESCRLSRSRKTEPEAHVPERALVFGTTGSKVLCRVLGAGMDAIRSRFPKLVRIETTNACNARCVICPHPDLQRPITHMDSALFERVIDECAAEGCRQVHLHNFGEPLMDQTIEECFYPRAAAFPRLVHANTQ